MTAALSLDDERELLDVARAATSAYLTRHPGLRHQESELLSDACLGAAGASLRHDPAGGASLRSFAFRRARGAILDGIRDRAPLSRHEAKVAGERATELAAARAPMPLEHLVDELGWEPATVDGGFEQVDKAESLADIRRQVVELVALCPPAEAVALLAVVGYQLPGEVVAERLGIHVGSVYRYKSLALRRIRAHLDDPDRPRPRPAHEPRSLRELHDALLTPDRRPTMSMPGPTPLLTPSTDQRIANLFLTGHGLDAVAERGLANGWTRADAQRVAEEHEWQLDRDGRIPLKDRRGAISAPSGPPAPAVNGGAPIDKVKDKIALALRHENAGIRRKAQVANEAIAKLDTALAQFATEKAARDRVAELEKALANAKAQLRGGNAAPRKATTSAAPGEAAQARAWAKENGVDCPGHGRVPGAVLDAYRAATTKPAGEH